MYIYPDNLKSKATLWLWELRDIGVIGIGAVIAIFSFSKTGFMPPLLIVAVYAFLSIRHEDTSIKDFVFYAMEYFFVRPQYYEWRLHRYGKKGKETGAGAAIHPAAPRDQGLYRLLPANRPRRPGVFIVKPTNISTMSETSVQARIYALMTVLKGLPGIEMFCTNSRENYEDNKQNLRSRLEVEEMPALRKLLEQEQIFLDVTQVKMATARDFLIIIRLRDTKDSEVFPYLSRIEKSLKDQSFSVMRAGKNEIYKLLAVYHEQNVTTESFEQFDFDGERWVITGD